MIRLSKEQVLIHNQENGDDSYFRGCMNDIESIII